MTPEYFLLELNDRWQLAQYDWKQHITSGYPALDGLAWLEASVPGAVHYDLIRAGELTNPFESTQAAFEAAWVAETDWIYRNRFSFDKKGLGSARIVLRFEGIDTFADIWLNEVFIGKTGNAFRTYPFELPVDLLKADDNVLIVHVKSHSRMIEPNIPEARRMNRVGEPSGLLGKSLIRRYQRNFYSNSSLLNLGTGVLGIGIYKPVEMEEFAGAFIEDCYFKLESLSSKGAKACVRVNIDRGDDRQTELTVEAILRETDKDQPVAVNSITTKEDSVELSLEIPHPRLWWPAGYGEPNLYHLTVNISDGPIRLHTQEKRVGLKQVELVTQQENGRKTFFFKVNGTKVYARGFNLIPLDYLKVHASWDAYANLFKIMQNAHTNMLRIWGGGVMESEQFYAACDELGIMLWQDFFLHSNVYPDYDPEFVADFRQEAIGVVKRLRNHACLTLLCGGNEQQEGWTEWNWPGEMDRFYGEKLILELLPQVAATYCPTVPFIVNSPHGGKWAQSPVQGDMHCWGNFYNATKDPQFVTETCWTLESYSRPETLKHSMNLDVDRLSGKGWPTQWQQLTGLPLMTRLAYSSHFDFSSLRNYLRSLEIEQTLADYHALSVLRLRSSSCNGILYWSLNKGGPLFGFGCVDYTGYPLMSYYAVKRLYADLLVGIYRDIDDIKVVVSNLQTGPVEAEVRLQHLDTKGTVLRHWEKPLRLAAGDLLRAFDLDSYYQNIVDRTQELMHVQLLVNGEVVSADALFFCPFSEFVITPEPLVVEVNPVDKNTWNLEMEVSTAAKMIEIEGNKKMLFGDNYFSLMPGSRKQVKITLLGDTAAEELELTVSSADNPDVRRFTLR